MMNNELDLETVAAYGQAMYALARSATFPKLQEAQAEVAASEAELLSLIRTLRSEIETLRSENQYLREIVIDLIDQYLRDVDQPSRPRAANLQPTI